MYCGEYVNHPFLDCAVHPLMYPAAKSIYRHQSDGQVLHSMCQQYGTVCARQLPVAEHVRAAAEGLFSVILAPTTSVMSYLLSYASVLWEECIGKLDSHGAVTC